MAKESFSHEFVSWSRSVHKIQGWLGGLLLWKAAQPTALSAKSETWELRGSQKSIVNPRRAPLKQCIYAVLGGAVLYICIQMVAHAGLCQHGSFYVIEKNLLRKRHGHAYYQPVPSAENFRDTLPYGTRAPLESHTRILRELLQEDAAPPPKFHVMPLYGGIDSHAYYYVSIFVGTPAQRQSVIFDTGSSVLGFPCRHCRSCGHSHIDPRFDFSASTTAMWIPCKDSRCHSKHCSVPSLPHAPNVCRYVQNYIEGSSITGNYFSDFIALGDDHRPVRFDYIGCHDSETQLFTTQKANGILGIAQSQSAAHHPTLMDVIFQDQNITENVFSICAAEEGGLITVGGYNSQLHRLSRTAESPRLRFLGLLQARRLDTAQRNDTFASEIHDSQTVEDADVLDAPASTTSTVAAGSLSQNARVPIAWTQLMPLGKYQFFTEALSYILGAKEDNAESMLITGEAEFGTCLVDSGGHFVLITSCGRVVGSTFSYFPDKVFTSIINALTRSCETVTRMFCLPKNSIKHEELCWRIDTPKLFARLPIFILRTRGGARVQWVANSYLHRHSLTIWCIAIDRNHQHQSVLGMSFLKGKDVIFDRRRSLLGFVEADCPTFSETERSTSMATSFPQLPVQNNTFPHTPPETSLDEHTAMLRQSVVWIAFGLFLALSVVALVAMIVKVLQAQRDGYERLETIRPVTEQDDVELGVRRRSIGRPSLTPKDYGSLPLQTTPGGAIVGEGDHAASYQYDVIEAELDKLERVTKS